MHRVETLPLVVHVDELFVDLADLAFVDGEGLSVGKGFDGGQLIQQDKVVIQNVVVDSIKIRSQNLLIHLVETSLFESHVHNATENFE